MTAADGASPADNASGQPGTPASDISTASDMRRLGISARASSPAKRTRDDRDGEEPETSHATQEMDVDAPAGSTIQTHSSPMPSRFKPVSLTTASSVDSPATTPDVRMSSPPLVSQDVSDAATEGMPAEERPSLDEQVRIVMELSRKEQIKEGTVGYVIPTKWLNRVQSRTTSGLHEGFDKSLREGDIGSVTTSELVLDAAHLQNLKDGSGHVIVPIKPGLVRPDDYEILPEEAWKLIIKWYGLESGSPTITRFAHNTSSSSEKDNCQYEMEPLLFRIQKVRNQTEGRGLESIRDEDQRAAVVVASRSEQYQNFLRRAKLAAGIQVTTKIRVWKVIEALSAEIARSAMPTPSPSRDPSPAPAISILPPLIVDMPYLNALEEGTNRDLVDLKDETANEKYNGSFKVGDVGFMEAQTLIFEEQIREGEQWRSELGRKAVTKPESKSNSLTVPNGTKTRGNIAAAKSNGSTSGMITRGRAKKGRTKGTVGLQNLGNTCYMNSALQCIRSVQELTLYFLAGKFKEELNSDNPLGHNGAIAKAYAGLVSSIYETDGSFSPRSFKATLGRCQPLFSGYGQQDSQEFLSFLIDGLHEDLNRIHKKPYLENPDSDDKTVHDPKAIQELGETYRKNHAARNDSVAMDLLSGFYKNTMVCPECDKVSITFDPFAQVTLQLPVDTPFQQKIAFLPLGTSAVTVDVDMDKNSSIKGLKEYIAKRVPGNVNPDRIIIAEEYTKKIYKVFEDNDVLSEANIQSTDNIWAYELEDVPTNWPPRQQLRKSKYHDTFSSSRNDDFPTMDSPEGQRLAVPVLHRLLERQKSSAWRLIPSLIMLTRDEAKDKESIFRKVLQKVQTLTTRDLYQELENDQSSTPDDSDDMVEVAAGNESGTASTVQTSTHGSDDSYVDVTMSDSTAVQPRGEEQSAANDSSIPHITTHGNDFTDHGIPISPYLRSLFDVSIHEAKNELIAAGHSTIGDRDKHSTLIKRRDISMSRVGSDAVIDDADSEDELTRTPDSVERSTHDDDLWAGDANADQEGYYIRLGTSIILDWDAESFDQCFGGSAIDGWRGRETFADKPIVPDAVLEAKRAKRTNRKKSGVTLEECFAETSKSEILSEDNAWYCNRCKELRRATKTLELWTVPDILVVHLKRFSSGSRLRDKVEILVDFPTRELDLSGKVGLPEDKSLIYDLFAVDNHYGGLGGGHYTAYAKNFFDDKWYDYNDSFVSQVSEEGVVTKAAYLLFYRRRSEKPLGPEYLQQIVEDAMSPENTSQQSGEGQRQDDSSSLSGSSTLSQPGAEVIHQPAQQLMVYADQTRGAAGGQDLTQGSQAKSALKIDDELPPPYNKHNEDEGYNSDPDNPIPGVEGYSWSQPAWSFDNITPSGTGAPPASNAGSESDTLHDLDSNAPAAGSEGGVELEDRLQQDFGNTTVLNFDENEERDDISHIERVPMRFDGPPDEDEAVDIRVTDEDESAS